MNRNVFATATAGLALLLGRAAFADDGCPPPPCPPEPCQPVQCAPPPCECPPRGRDRAVDVATSLGDRCAVDRDHGRERAELLLLGVAHRAHPIAQAGHGDRALVVDERGEHAAQRHRRIGHRPAPHPAVHHRAGLLARKRRETAPGGPCSGASATDLGD